MMRRSGGHGEALEKGDSVILDATLIAPSLRRRTAEIAAKHNKAFVVPANPSPWHPEFRRNDRLVSINDPPRL
jgi:predicted kinase